MYAYGYVNNYLSIYLSIYIYIDIYIYIYVHTYITISSNSCIMHSIMFRSSTATSRAPSRRYYVIKHYTIDLLYSRVIYYINIVYCTILFHASYDSILYYTTILYSTIYYTTPGPRVPEGGPGHLPLHHRLPVLQGWAT